MIDQTKLRRGDLDLVAIGKFADRVFRYSRMFEAFFGEFFLESPLDTAIQFCPFFLGKFGLKIG